MKTKTQQNRQEITHWRNVIKKIECAGDKRGYNTTDERQQKYLAESKIEQIYETGRL